MAKHKKKSAGGDCTRQRISFKTKRGKVISFMGRPGGMTSAGGSCSVLKRTATGKMLRSTKHLAKFKLAFKKAVAACDSKSHTKHSKHGKSPFNTCVGSKL